jgi:hypothetical protein
MSALFQILRLRALLVTGIIAVMSFSNNQSAMAAGSLVTTTTTLVMTSSGNSVASGGSVTSGSEITLTAAVSGGSAKVTVGQVNFCDASATYCTDIHLLGTAQLTSTGTAVFRLHPGIGDRSYKAVFVGTLNGTPAYSGSISGTVALTVTGRFPPLRRFPPHTMPQNKTIR